MLLHTVFFTLKDSTPAAQKKLVEATRKYLSKHAGTVHFASGTRAEALARPVNDKEFHVALCVCFTDQAAHDRYQEADDHHAFIAECKDNWKQVRVFDAEV